MKRELIIDSPSMQSLWQRYSSVIITFAFWVLWFFLWVPVITAIAWYQGLHIAYFEMFEMDGFKAVIASFFTFFKVVMLLGGSLAVWASYNFFRFRGKDRRKAVMPVTVKDLADFFDLDEKRLTQLQQEKIISVSFDANGQIASINTFRPDLRNLSENTD
jgi:biofilm PGA synthesis protein PgaD